MAVTMKARYVGLLTLFVAGCGTPSAQPAAAPESTPPPAATTAEAAPTPTEAPPATEATTESPAETAEPPKVEEPGTPREKLMRAHFSETELIRAAVIRGNPSAAIGPAKSLTKMDEMGKMPASWKPTLSAMQKAVARIKNSPDIPAVAAATADLGVACGSCHKKGEGPKVEVGSPPEAGSTVKSQMRRHAWANERLWEGLYVPSDDAWKAGVDALKGDIFPKDALKGVHARSAVATLKRVVESAGSKKTPQDRAATYAQILETCAACHTAMRD